VLECFLLLRHTGAKWVPILAIPGVIAGMGASVCLILSGIKGIIGNPRQSKPRTNQAASPARVVEWIAKRPTANSSHG